MNKHFLISITALLLSLAFVSCHNDNGHPETVAASQQQSFAAARKGFVTKLTKQTGAKGEVETPPEELFSIVHYPTQLGKMAAYLSTIPNDGKLHPAMIWITGGFGNDISDVWSEQDPENDQSAAVIREAGIVMMYPSQRGGNTNAGADESCFGEIDDILAAAAFLEKQTGIDPARIYLGGHSTGGTKVLLAAECSNRFRAVFSFGPVAAVADYGEEELTFDTHIEKERELREPIRWLSSLQTPAFIFEGADGNSNIASLRELEAAAQKGNNPYAHFYPVKNKDHFSTLQPVSKLIAQKMIADDKGGDVKMNFEKELNEMKSDGE